MDAWAPQANYIENDFMKILLMIIFANQNKKRTVPDGLEPPTFRLTAAGQAIG